MVDKNLKNVLWWMIPIAFLLWPISSIAEWGLNMPRGVTPISREVFDLHMLILWIVVIIGIGVFGVMAWSIYHHRKSKGFVAAQFHHSTTIEIIWAIVPAIILILMAIPATKTLKYMEQTSDTEMTLKVTGYQWKWKYDYLDEDLSFFSVLAQDSQEARALNSGIDPASVDNYLLEVDKPVVLPVDTKIRILTTANDVIHGWWVPALGWKRDAVPGFINDNWVIIEEEGTYRGQCTELCGRDHAFMPIVLEVVSKEDYRTWVADTKQTQLDAQAGSDREWTMDELMVRGEEVYGAQCAACHQANGQGVPGVFAALDGSAIVNGTAGEHIKLVLEGKNLMAAFAEQLSDADLAAVITYERNSWSNSTGDRVQPSDVKAKR